MVFDIKVIHQRIQTTRSHASRCHHHNYCNLDFVLFHWCHMLHWFSIIMHSCYTIHTSFYITCNMVATCMISRRLSVYVHDCGRRDKYLWLTPWTNMLHKILQRTWLLPPLEDSTSVPFSTQTKTNSIARKKAQTPRKKPACWETQEIMPI